MLSSRVRVSSRNLYEQQVKMHHLHSALFKLYLGNNVLTLRFNFLGTSFNEQHVRVKVQPWIYPTLYKR